MSRRLTHLFSLPVSPKIFLLCREPSNINLTLNTNQRLAFQLAQDAEDQRFGGGTGTGNTSLKIPVTQKGGTSNTSAKPSQGDQSLWCQLGGTPYTKPFMTLPGQYKRAFLKAPRQIQTDAILNEAYIILGKELRGVSDEDMAPVWDVNKLNANAVRREAAAYFGNGVEARTKRLVLKMMDFPDAE